MNDFMKIFRDIHKYIHRDSHQRCSIEKLVFRDFAKLTGKLLCQSFFIKKETEACNFIKKETMAQAFSCEFSRGYFSKFTPHFL